jgi:isocitrate dehydrogenase kinase/phosphatase
LLRVKEHYTHLLPDYPRFEIAESFFNSVYCRLFDHRSLTPSGSLFSARSPSVLSHPSATAGERFLSRSRLAAPAGQSAVRSAAAAAVAK